MIFDRLTDALMGIPARMLPGIGHTVAGLGAGVIGQDINGGLGAHLGHLVGSGIRKTATTVVPATISAVPYAARGAKSLLDVAFVKDAEGAAFKNLYTGRKINPVAMGALELGGIGLVLTGSRSEATIQSAVPSTPNNAMPQLYSSGNDPAPSRKNNLGADGDLALALHYNRHGR
jgi:hypothetical protein